MDEALLAEYRASTYVVCVDQVHWPVIHLDRPLPPILQTLVGAHAWAFITAWNPGSVRRPDSTNEAAQHELLRELDQHAEVPTILPAMGIGPDGWHEPSLFVVGPEFVVFDALGIAHGQNAYLRGRGKDRASLRILCR